MASKNVMLAPLRKRSTTKRPTGVITLGVPPHVLGVSWGAILGIPPENLRGGPEQSSAWRSSIRREPCGLDVNKLANACTMRGVAATRTSHLLEIAPIAAALLTIAMALVYEPTIRRRELERTEEVRNLREPTLQRTSSRRPS